MLCPYLHTLQQRARGMFRWVSLPAAPDFLLQLNTAKASSSGDAQFRGLAKKGSCAWSGLQQMPGSSRSEEGARKAGSPPTTKRAAGKGRSEGPGSQQGAKRGRTLPPGEVFTGTHLLGHQTSKTLLEEAYYVLLMASLARQGAEAEQAGRPLSPLQLLSPTRSTWVCIR